nr:hypothetical protein [Clostridium sp. AWRP]
MRSKLMLAVLSFKV